MIDSLPIASPLLFWGFVALPCLLAGTVVLAIRHTSGAAIGRLALLVATVWMGLTGYLGWAGHLDAWAPPRMLFLLVPMLVGLAWAARQPWTGRLGDLSLSLLVGFQSFRILVELLLHQAVLEGVAHPTMTWSGTNLDIVAGVTALVLAPFASRLNRRLLQGWNLAMAGVLVVTVVSGAFRQIMGDPPNGFIAGFPFTWLPSVLVVSAWLGHIVLFRRLRRPPDPTKGETVTKGAPACETAQ
jgi:hypothetical protein